MSIYRRLHGLFGSVLGEARTFKWGFNLSPMYRRSTARIVHVSDDLMQVRIRLRTSWRNRNYMGSIFGGSMFAAVDPIPMIQLVGIFGDDYVVWDKRAEIHFRRPAREDLFAEFIFTAEEVAAIKADVAAQHEIDHMKVTRLTGRDGSTVYCEVHKTIYIAEKSFFKAKQRARKERG